MNSKQYVEWLDKEPEPLRWDIVNSAYVQTMITGGYNMR